jgi:hypothetical protein
MQNFLQCDAEGCGHHELVDALTENLIGMPYPKCSASLLTREDYEAAMPAFKMMNAMDKLFGEMGLIAAPGTPGTTRLSVGIHNGETSIKIKPEAGV